MKTEGFIFDHGRCVACGACSAACVLENGFDYRPRSIFSYNAEGLPDLPVLHVSLACNHCADAICMDGCPSSAIYRDKITGAVLINGKRCIGCRYCLWNCPYSAPKYLHDERITAKCTLCPDRLNDGLHPACTTACPTGALSFGDIKTQENSLHPGWFPDKGLQPALILKGPELKPLRIIPELIPGEEFIKQEQVNPGIFNDPSLVFFTFLATLSAALSATSLITGSYDHSSMKLILVVLAGLSSLFHLGRKARAWRAVANLVHSPLSREIALFLVFGILTILSSLSPAPWLMVSSVLTGFVLLVSIDAVYIFSDGRKRTILHEGSAFISGLGITAFLSGRLLPFLFIAVIKLVSAVLRFSKKSDPDMFRMLALFRISLLLIACGGVISGLSFSDPAILIVFLAGELLSRIIFYFDFNPVSILSSIHNFRQSASQ